MIISGGTCGVELSSAEVLAKQAVHLRAWSDPGVVKLHEQAIRDETAYLSLEYLPGPTLRQLIRGKQANVETLVEILETLERVAARSLIQYHGDLKPENFYKSGRDPAFHFNKILALTGSHYCPDVIGSTSMWSMLDNTTNRGVPVFVYATIKLGSGSSSSCGGISIKSG
jgi:hypothetical protein